jgi:signal transduction histidine kinase
MSSWTTGARRVGGVVLTFTNVTAFRASIDQAIYERECTKAILNTVADPLVILSADQRIESGNRAFYTMFQVSRDETQGVPLCELGNGAFALAPLRTQLELLLAGSKAFEPVEVGHVITQNGRRTLLLSAHPLSLPGHRERRVLVTFQDITVRKLAEAAKDLRSEEELRHSEALLAEGQRLSSTGTFSWKVASDEITWSEQLYCIYEFEIGVPVTLELMRTRVHPDDLTLSERMIEEARRGGEDFEWQYRLVMPDHSIKYLHAVARATQDRDGQLEYIAAIQDATERQLADQALSKLRADLAHVSRVSMLGVLTASIAHEVNQPLAAIVVNGQSCLRWLARNDPNIEEVRGLTNRVVDEAWRASDIIERILGLATQRAPEQKQLSIDDVINESLNFLHHELTLKGIVVSLALAPKLPQIIGDRTQLQQVMVNLIINAVQAMAQLAPAQRRISVRTALSDAETVYCSVEDSGPGIDSQHLPRLFDRFFTTKDTGMGMGLAICRSIIEAHGGRVCADNKSALGGARFSFYLLTHPAE